MNERPLPSCGRCHRKRPTYGASRFSTNKNNGMHSPCPLASRHSPMTTLPMARRLSASSGCLQPLSNIISTTAVHFTVSFGPSPTPIRMIIPGRSRRPSWRVAMSKRYFLSVGMVAGKANMSSGDRARDIGSKQLTSIGSWLCREGIAGRSSGPVPTNAQPYSGASPMSCSAGRGTRGVGAITAHQSLNGIINCN